MKEGLRRFVKRHAFLLAAALAVLFCSRKANEALSRIVRPFAIARYMKTHEVRKLQIGGGKNVLPGWLNTDRSASLTRVLFLDAANRFPFKDATFDYVYSEHLIEHLTYQQGQAMLRECFRVLKPGGRIRTATPDLEALVGLYAPQKSAIQERYIHWVVDNFYPEIGIYQPGVALNSAMRNFGHQFLYDFVLLRTALEKAGFVAVVRYRVGESDDGAFRGIESHAAAGDEEMNSFETMVVEAMRPL